MVDFWWQMFSLFSTRENAEFFTENFTTFFTTRKDICHLELTLGVSSSKKTLNVYSGSRDLNSRLPFSVRNRVFSSQRVLLRIRISTNLIQIATLRIAINKTPRGDLAFAGNEPRYAKSLPSWAQKSHRLYCSQMFSPSCICTQNKIQKQFVSAKNP